MLLFNVQIYITHKGKTMYIKANIRKLKDMTVKRDIELATLFDFFLTNLGENREFHSLGKPYKKENDFYTQMLLPLCQRLDENLSVSQLFISRVKKYDFIHGGFFLSNCAAMGTLFWFNDILMGLSAIPYGGTTHFFRISALKTENKPGVILPSTANSTLH